ncbi:DNA endonuclease RBBP8 isoform X3 [Plectropomus leopardus]|uniref:DNA endonuclease RBBP8 isoform X3 n=1 Tax=Plectropomus leopardus TaxID=160734 RepID=UPI001C4C1430|nr:DNA endonuclease RBBP8 isoform X3 [Plectropomus leopardus]
MTQAQGQRRSPMECFNSLLLKLREVHEREVEGWQVKIQELSNKKGCDTKRMEELFTKNQQMKEQQRLLTENIKTLENRLRAGLCDRCTVTQEVAKRRQQEFEASQIQSLQHISLLAGEMNNLKKENRKLRDELRNVRASLDRGQSDHSSNSSITAEVKVNSSPDLSPPSGPVALITMATSRAGNQPADGNVAVKAEVEQRTEESEHRQLRGMSRSHFESYKPLSWKTEHSVTHVGERRAQTVEGLDQRPSTHPQALLLKNSSSSNSREVNPSRHVLHAPVPCRPQPIKSSHVTLPWPLPESSDWVTEAAGTSLGVQPSTKPNLPRFPNLIPTSQYASSRGPMFGSPWHKQNFSQPLSKEPTVVFRLRSPSEQMESQSKLQEKKELPPTKTEVVAGERLREAYEGPLDLSDRGKAKSSQTPRDDSPLALQGGEKAQRSPDKDGKALGPISTPCPAAPDSSSLTSPIKQQEEESISDRNHKVITDQEQEEEVIEKMEQSNGKKVPVLTISLRPVVVLETLNPAMQESLSSNGKSSSPAVERGGSSDEQDDKESVSGLEGSQGCKRKRASVETETDRDSESDNIHQERKIKITVRAEEKSSC